LAGEKDKICPLRSNAQERILLARADQLGSQDLLRKIKLVAPWLGKMISRCTAATSKIHQTRLESGSACSGGQETRNLRCCQRCTGCKIKTGTRSEAEEEQK
jgi:hypothetical protein